MAKKSPKSIISIIAIGLITIVLSKMGFLSTDKPETSQEETPATQVADVNLQNLPNSAKSFSGAKSLLYKKIYTGHTSTFYCGCDFDAKKRTVDLDSCGVTPRRNVKRAQRVEAEHVMPAHHFGQHRQCWREPKTFCPREAGKKPYSGRQCCERADPVFETAHNDLHNLFPAVGEINGDRSNYRWGMLSGEPRIYGQCNFEVDSKLRRAEPPEAARGNIARVYFYMEEIYGFNISRQQRQLFNAWHKQDPVDAWEKERNQRITNIQGKPNPFISGTMKPRPTKAQ